MTMTLVQICAAAIESHAAFDAPSTIIGNSDETALILKQAALQTGRELMRNYSWQALKTAYSFNTVASTAAYALPSDFQRFANLTFFNTTDGQPLLGPNTNIGWAELTNGINVLNYQFSFHVSGGNLRLSPTPSAVYAIGYDYYSKQYSTTSGGTAQDNWAADSDLPRLPDDIFVLGVRFHFLKRKGLPFAEDKADYLEAIAQQLFDDTPRAVTNLTGVPVPLSNLPDSNFG